MTATPDAKTNTLTRKAPASHRIRSGAAIAIVLVLCLPPATALVQINVATTDTTDISNAYGPNPPPDTYAFTLNDPPFTNHTAGAFAIEGKQDWGTIPANGGGDLVSVSPITRAPTGSIRHSYWNYTLSNTNGQTHTILFDNMVYPVGFSQFLGVWESTILVTIDGILTYRLDEGPGTPPAFLDYKYKTSFIIGMALNKTLRSWNLGNTNPNTFGNQNSLTICCGAYPNLEARYTTSFNNYASAVFIANPAAGTTTFGSLTQNNNNTNQAWFYAFNMTGIVSVTVNTTYDGPVPNSVGFVYSFCNNCTSISDQNAGTTITCNGSVPGLIYRMFGFCPDVAHIMDYAAGFVGGLFTFPLRLIGDANAGTLSNGASNLADLIQSIADAYGFILALIVTDPVQLFIVVLSLGTSYSAVIAAITRDFSLAFRGSIIVIKWYGMFIIGYFLSLFYLAKAIATAVFFIINLLVGIAETIFGVIP